MNQEYNHHTACVLPYFQSGSQTYFLFEQKCHSYPVDAFRGSLTFIGGNWTSAGHDSDASPLDTLKREISEEYWLCDEPTENLSDIIAGISPNHTVNSEIVPLAKRKNGQTLGRRLLENINPFCTYDVRVAKSLLCIDSDLSYLNSVFTAELSAFDEISDILAVTKGIVTTDNYLYGSKLVLKSATELQSALFGWGYDTLFSEITGLALIPNGNLVDNIRINALSFNELTYDSLRTCGVSYRHK